MIIGIGVDAVDIARFETSLERTPGLRERLFTEAERELTIASLAARFAAKEAVAKALALEAWAFQDVEIVATATAPEVRLSGAAAQRAEELGAHPRISLTHTRDTAAAVAFLA